VPWRLQLPYAALPKAAAAGNYSIVCNGVSLSQDCYLLSRLIGMIANCCITVFTFPPVIYRFL
jgi:hypothetical protein